MPLTIDSFRLFNPLAGYASSVLPAVIILVVHQTSLLGIGLVVAGYRERGADLACSFLGYLGTLLAFATFTFAATLFYAGYVLTWWDFPRGGRFADVVAFAALFSLATASFGVGLGVWFDRRERVMQIWTPSSIPLLFLAGYSWPSVAIGPVLRAVRWLVPATAGISGFTQIAQMHASWTDTAPQVLDLTAICLGGATLGFLMLRFRARRTNVSP